jgi:chaperone required for assembly of F1-ATPase
MAWTRASKVYSATRRNVIRSQPKRFYKAASVVAADAAFRVCLDGRPVKTPGRAEMLLPSRPLAETVAGEWAAQGESIDLAAMPLTVLSWAAIDRVRPDRARVIAETAAYGGHDLVCYRADGPADLAARQQAAWQPLLDWARQELDAPLVTTAGIVSVAQPEAALAALSGVVASRTDFELVALSAAVKAAGSLVIGLALCAGRIDARAAFDAGQLDETYQMERWGEDPEAAGRRAAIRRDLEAATRMVALLRG